MLVRLLLSLLIVLNSYCCIAQTKFSVKQGTRCEDIISLLKKENYTVFIFGDSGMANGLKTSQDLCDVEPEAALKNCFKGTYLECVRVGRNIIISCEHCGNGDICKPVTGRVTNSEGLPMAGVLLADSLEKDSAMTDQDGGFYLSLHALSGTIWVYCTGYETQRLTVDNRILQTISMKEQRENLSPFVVQSNASFSSRLPTSSIHQVKENDIIGQPVSNVLGALDGRMPGLLVNQVNGVPGSHYKLTVRGTGSIEKSTDPLLVVDGVPIITSASPLNVIGSGSAQGINGADPLNYISPSDVSSVVVLKDAAATAIYGSRGSNGVIIVALKQGMPGALKWTADAATGGVSALPMGRLMDTKQYLAMRTAAIKNDSLAVNPGSLPEKFLWDSSRYTDYRHVVMGRMAATRDLRAGVVGGDTLFHFLLHGSYHDEGAVFPGVSQYRRSNGYGNFHYRSADRKLSMILSGIYSRENTALPMEDLTPYIYLAPNAPAFTDSMGQPAWGGHGLSAVNIPARTKNTYRAGINTLFSHLQCSYTLLPGFYLRSSLGYTKTTADEETRLTVEGQDPSSSPTGTITTNNNRITAAIAELTTEYTRRAGKFHLEGLGGVTWQQQRAGLSALTNSGFTSDVLMSTGTGAPQTSSMENSVSYRYAALFARTELSYDDRLILTGSLRRDGSSRFGPAKQYGNFWALGGAWVFSRELFTDSLPWLSYGKLHANIGTSGNDELGDNAFASIYRSTTANRGYQGMQGVFPSTYNNNDLSWELNRKEEIAIELGLVHNRVILTLALYHNVASNLVVFDALPSQSGIPTTLKNEDVHVVNNGAELFLQTHNYLSGPFRWTSYLTLTAPRNYLASFPGLNTSVYAGVKLTGQSLSEINVYRSTGVNSETGLYTFRDVHKDGVLDKQDFLPGGNKDPKLYGGLGNSFQYKRLQLDVFFSFRKQYGPDPIVARFQQIMPGSLGNNPGSSSTLGNYPVQLLDRWQGSGGYAHYQRVSSQPNTPANDTLAYYINSNAQLTDASFIRLKNVSLSWLLPVKFVSKLHLKEGKLYLRAENLWTWKRFPLADPETQDPDVLPPMRTIMTGIQVNF